MRYLIFCIFLLSSGVAYADCTGPTGAEGQIIFNRAHKIMQFCDGDKWFGMAGGGGSIKPDDLFSTTDDLSDISYFYDASSTAKTVNLVDVTGSGYLLSGGVKGFYPTDMSDNNYRITITIDGAAPIAWPPGPVATHYYNDEGNSNLAAIIIPPIAFQSSLKIQYKLHSSTRRVYGYAIVKQ